MPASPPPFLNRPGHALRFDLNRAPSDRPQDDASALATWLDELRTQCYVNADAAEHWGDDDDEAADSPI
jgi:hypothetical protein